MPSKTSTTTQTVDVDAVQKVADATKLEGLSVETRQQGKRAVILITDEHSTRLLAYVTPKVKGGYAIEIADYGAYRRESAKTVAAAAKAVKTSKRVKPKVKPEPKATTSELAKSEPAAEVTA